MTHIETERLLLRDWRPEDTALFAGINADPRVMEHFPSTLSERETIDFIGRITGELSRCGYGLWAVERKSDGAFMGYTGFHGFDFEADFSPGTEIGWRLGYDYWGHGYATEAASACLEYAAHSLDLRTVWSFTAHCNRRSERVMQKIGMRPAGRFLHPALPDGHPLREHLLYRIDI